MAPAASAASRRASNCGSEGTLACVVWEWPGASTEGTAAAGGAMTGSAGCAAVSWVKGGLSAGVAAGWTIAGLADRTLATLVGPFGATGRRGLTRRGAAGRVLAAIGDAACGA